MTKTEEDEAHLRKVMFDAGRAAGIMEVMQIILEYQLEHVAQCQEALQNGRDGLISRPHSNVTAQIIESRVKLCNGISDLISTRLQGSSQWLPS